MLRWSWGVPDQDKTSEQIIGVYEYITAVLANTTCACSECPWHGPEDRDIQVVFQIESLLGLRFSLSIFQSLQAFVYASTE
jgi:hypothetical protein